MSPAAAPGAGEEPSPGPSQLRAVQATYDTVAVDYARLLPDLGPETGLDTAMLAAFAEQARAAAPAPVVDVGCGAGRVTAHLHSLGLDVSGVDLSPGMVEVARRTHPHLRFDAGSMTALDAADGSLGGVLAWYSVIHTPPEELPEVFAEFARVLAPGAPVLLGFHAGDGHRAMTQAYGHEVRCDSYRFPVDRIAALLGAPGFDVHTRLLRAPAGRGEDPAGQCAGAQDLTGRSATVRRDPCP